MTGGDKSPVTTKRAAPLNGSNYDGKITKVQRRWTHEEVQEIFSYLIETTEKNLVIEKPTASVYYGEMIAAKSFLNCTPSVVRDKVRHLLSKYKEALKWTNGQGAHPKKSDDFEEIFCQRFPYFKLAETVWGSRTDIHVPLTIVQKREYFKPGRVFLNNGNRNEVGLTTTNHVDNEVIFEEVESPVERNKRKISATSSEWNLSPTTPIKLLNRENLGIVGASNRSRDSTRIGVIDSLEAYSLKPTKILPAPANKPEMLPQSDQELQQHCQESDKEFQRFKWQAEYDLRQLEVQNNKEIRMKELETQVRLKELEVEKLKLELELKNKT